MLMTHCLPGVELGCGLRLVVEPSISQSSRETLCVELVLILFLFQILLTYLCVYLLGGACEGQRIMCGGLCSPSHHGVLGIR